MKPEKLLDGKVLLYPGDMLKVLPTLKANSIDSVVCDPPYNLSSIVKRFGSASADDVYRNADLRKAWHQGKSPFSRGARGFMGKKWDSDIASEPETWVQVYRVLKPGGHVVAFGGTRTFGRMQLAMELAGFEIRDTIMWLYGSGFPKSHDVSKHVDAKLVHGKTSTRQLRKVNENRPGEGKKGGRLPNAGIMSGNMRAAAISRDQPITKEAAQWSGWGTALKPACELIVLARKPLDGTVAENVLKWGVGALNIDGSRIPTGDDLNGGAYAKHPTAREQLWGEPAGNSWRRGGARPKRVIDPKPSANGPVYSGRQKAGSGFDGGSKAMGFTTEGRWPANVVHDGSAEVVAAFPDDEGSNAARFFYTAKADSDDRIGSKHPTVKPVDLMRYLVKLVTPPGGLVLDPFAGTGTTGEAAWREGMRVVLVELEPDYQADIRVRLNTAKDYYAREVAKNRNKPRDMGPLFT